MKKPARKAKPVARPRPSAELVAARRSLDQALAKIPPAPVTELVDASARVVNEGLAIGALGIDLPQFTEKEERILDEPAPIAEIRMKPSGQPYLSHPSYTRWFNRAFGRGGWTLVPIGKAALSGKSLVVPYVLYIHGKPAAFAQGEQDYFESNREQSYGDALEATVASALRRCAKRLGVGLELWDKPFLESWIREHCVKVAVEVERDGRHKVGYLWRRTDDPPFWNEINGARVEQLRNQGAPVEQTQRRDESPTAAPPRQSAPAGHHAASGDAITDKQRGRLWAIMKSSGRDEPEVKAWLERRYGWTSTRQVTRRDYDAVCKAIEAPGPLR